MASKEKNEVFITPPVIISYPHLFEAQKMEDKDIAMFSAGLVFPPDTPPEVRRKLQELIDAAGRAFHGKNYDQMKQNGELTMPIRTDWAKKGYPEGSYYLNAKTKTQPGVVGPSAGKDGRPMLITNPDDVYPGCIVRASINFFGYSRKGNAGVSTGLRNVQKIREGTRLDSKRLASDEFDAIESAAWDDALI